MSHTLHHLRWLVRRFRLPVILFGLPWLLLTVVVWTVPVTDWDGLFPLTHVALMIPACLLVIAAVWQDGATGTDPFWRTRPPRWWSVWLSQVLFILLCAAGPAILCWLANGLLMHHTAAQWKYGALDLLFIVCPLLGLAGAVSFSRDWMTLVVVLAAVTLAVAGGFLLMLKTAAGVSDGQLFKSLQGGFYGLTSVWVIPALTLVLAWMTGMRRRGSTARIVTALLWLLSLPSLFWLVVRPWPDVVELHVAATTAGAPLQPGEQAAGVLILRGVPERTEAVFTDDYLRLDNRVRPDLPPTESYVGPQLRSNIQSADYSRRPRDLTAHAGKTIRAALPSGTHWYADDMAAGAEPFAWELTGLTSRQSLTRPLWGDAGGMLISTVQLVTVPLEEGATGAANGNRVCIQRLRHGQENLAVTVDLWRAAAVNEPMPPRGTAGGSNLTGRDPLPVLYFPAVPMAVVLMNTQPKGGFRSWQCQTRRHQLRLSIPEAEAGRGVRFTPETMRGAQLIYFSIAFHGTFSVTHDNEPVTILVK